MSGRVTSPVFVGRRVELAELEAAVAAAADGQPSLTLVDGEAGIGKSRLIAELVASLRADGRAPPTTGAPRRWSWPGAASRSATAACRSARSSRSSGHWSARSRVRSCVTRSGRPRPSSPGSSPSCPTGRSPSCPRSRGQTGSRAGSSRGSSACSGGSAPRPPSSSSSRTSTGPTHRLATCSRSWPATCATERLAIVATIRTDDLEPGHPLLAWLTEMERLPRVDRIALHRLDRDRDRRPARGDPRARRRHRTSSTRSWRDPTATRSSPRRSWRPARGSTMPPCRARSGTSSSSGWPVSRRMPGRPWTPRPWPAGGSIRTSWPGSPAWTSRGSRPGCARRSTPICS